MQHAREIRFCAVGKVCCDIGSYLLMGWQGFPLELMGSSAKNQIKPEIKKLKAIGNAIVQADQNSGRAGGVLLVSSSTRISLVLATRKARQQGSSICQCSKCGGSRRISYSMIDCYNYLLYLVLPSLTSVLPGENTSRSTVLQETKGNAQEIQGNVSSKRHRHEKSNDYGEEKELYEDQSEGLQEEPGNPGEQREGDQDVEALEEREGDQDLNGPNAHEEGEAAGQRDQDVEALKEREGDQDLHGPDAHEEGEAAGIEEEEDEEQGEEEDEEQGEEEDDSSPE
eukprot:g45273.t1